MTLEERPGSVTNEPPPDGIVFVPQKLPPPLSPRSRFIRDRLVAEALRDDNLNEGNRNGFKTEIRVGRLLGRLPYVTRVRQNAPLSPQDKNLEDLLVTMNPDFAIPFVRVQVKRKHDDGHRFSRRVSRLVSEDNPRFRKLKLEKNRMKRKKEWLMAKRIVIIYGTRQKGTEVVRASSEEIVASFVGQIAQIAAFEREKRHAA